jgi:hypothetical protein
MWLACAVAAAQAQPPQKTCDELQASAGTDELNAASDGRYSKSNSGAILRGAIIAVRAQKRIQAQCSAEGKTDAAEQARLSIGSAVTANVPLFLEFLGYRQSLSDLEEARFDKQEGSSTSGGAGSTTLATKGNIPSLLGFAVENGALTRSVTGTTATFTAVPWNVIRALQEHNYLRSGPTPQPGTLEGLLSDVGVYVSFDASRGAGGSTDSTGTPELTGDKQQVSGYGVHFSILNWRDPRNVRYARLWNKLRDNRGRDLANRLNDVATLLRAGTESSGRAQPWVADFEAWRQDTITKLEAASVDDVEKTIAGQADAFKAIIDKYPELQTRVRAADAALSDFFLSRNNQITKITKAWTLAFDYSVLRQANTNGTVDASGNAIVPTRLPDLSNFKLIFAKGFADGPELTGNLSYTLFTNLRHGASTPRLRDAQAAMSLDVPLPEILRTCRMVLSFSGEYIHLFTQPLGDPVLVNGVAVTRPGNIGLGQMKLSVPVKGTGVQIPLSVTWSNRTELILERDVRASFGVTLDLDTLFAKSN